MIIRGFQEVFFYFARQLSSELERVILMYHSINSETPSELNVSPMNFQEQMRYLAEHCDVVSLNDILGIKPKRHTVAITFDDGYEDNYTVALPILASYGLPATIFITTGLVKSHYSLSPDTHLKMLSWDQIKELSQSGITIGAHTVSHHKLTKISRDEAREEIQISKAELEDRLGTQVKWFAYPFGSRRAFNPDIVNMVAQADFCGAVTSEAGILNETVNRFVLPRVGVYSWISLNQFRGRMSRGIQVYTSFRETLKKLANESFFY